MDEPESRVVITLLWPHKHGLQVIHAHFWGTLGAPAVPLPTVKRSACRFRAGDTSCEDEPKLGRPLIILGDVLSKFLLKHLFASVKIIAKHFDLSGLTMKNLLIGEIWIRKFTRRWVRHSLSGTQKRERATQSKLLLDLLHQGQEAAFKAIVTGNES
jgi:hypothetical protein